jgi:hypothetical protein
MVARDVTAMVVGSGALLGDWIAVEVVFQRVQTTSECGKERKIGKRIFPSDARASRMTNTISNNTKQFENRMEMEI